PGRGQGRARCSVRPARVRRHAAGAGGALSPPRARDARGRVAPAARRRAELGRPRPAAGPRAGLPCRAPRSARRRRRRARLVVRGGRRRAAGAGRVLTRGLCYLPVEENGMDDSGATIEQDVRFSEPILWKLPRQYYDLRGPQAWASGAVPSYVTTNPYIAHVYAHIVLAYLRDAAASLDRERPIYIVELAAGSGRFAYLFLKAFHALKNASSVRALDVRYVMTDFTRANVRAWAAQPAFKPFLDAGLLDLGIFDAERDREIQLVGARGGVLAAGGLANPSIVLANYAFDTLVQDLFRVENGKLHEVRVSLRSRQAQPDLSRPEIMSELQCRYANREIGAAYYDDPGLNAMLEGYRASLAETTFAVPIGAFTALRNLIDIAGGRL